MGRPRKYGKETKTLSVRLEEDEREKILEKIKESGLTISEFFRDAIITNRTKVVAPSAEQALKIEQAAVDARRTRFLASKASNNINQLAHRANSEFLTGVISENTYLDILDDLEAMRLFFGASVKC